MTTKEIKSLFPIDIDILKEDRDKAIHKGGLHKLGLTLLEKHLPKELHEDIFWGLSIGTVKGVEIETAYDEIYKGKNHRMPYYLDLNFKGDKIKFELRTKQSKTT